MVIWGEVYTSIEPYFVSGYWYDGTEWVTIYNAMEMVGGREYWINVSQDCTLDWNEYHFSLTEGANTITWPSSWWQKYAVLLVIAVIFLVIIVLVYRAKW